MKTLNDNTTILNRAEAWAASLWREAGQRWTERSGQDLNYRRFVVHPAVSGLLGEFCGGSPLDIVELGCGDGILLDEPSLKGRMAGGGSYLGVDRAPEFLAAARKKHPEAWCRFIEASLEDDDFADRIGSYGVSWNCALTIFAVQEIPGIESLVGNAAAILGDGAFFLLVTVHPDFGDWLRDTGRMPPVTELDPAEPNAPAPWRWAGSYPIVDEPREPFHLPYFHRTAVDYETILSAHGLSTVTVRELPDPAGDLPRLVREGISPFADFPANLYWPRIGEAPSSLAILSRKEAPREAS